MKLWILLLKACSQFRIFGKFLFHHEFSRTTNYLDLSGVSVFRATLFECLQHIHINLRQVTTSPSFTSKSCSLSFFEHRSTCIFLFIYSEGILFGLSFCNNRECDHRAYIHTVDSNYTVDQVLEEKV